MTQSKKGFVGIEDDFGNQLTIATIPISGATGSVASSSGSVLASAVGGSESFFRDDGTWKKPYVNVDTIEKLYVLGATSSGNTDLD